MLVNEISALGKSKQGRHQYSIGSILEQLIRVTGDVLGSHGVCNGFRVNFCR